MKRARGGGGDIFNTLARILHRTSILEYLNAHNFIFLSIFSTMPSLNFDPSGSIRGSS